MKYSFCLKNSDLLESIIFQSEINLDDIKLLNSNIYFEVRRPYWELLKTKKLLFIKFNEIPSIVSKITIHNVDSISINGEKIMSGDFQIESMSFLTNQISLSSIDQEIVIKLKNDSSDMQIIMEDISSPSKSVFRKTSGNKDMNYKEWLSDYNARLCK